MKNLFLYTFLFFTSFCSLPIMGATLLEQAREKINAGEFLEGKEILNKAVAENKKNAQNVTYLYLLGVCEIETGDDVSGIKNLESAKKKGSDEAAFKLGEIAYYNYDFDSAEENFSEYRRLREKNKKEISPELNLMEKRLNIAENALARVEKITVIDSISLPRESFYLNYKLSPSSGQIISSSGIADNPLNGSEGALFINEEKDYIIGSIKNESGELELVDGIQLLNGQWLTNPLFQEDFEIDGDYAYGFMSTDGQTLYFANNGEESMGGYDLFVAQKDPISGEYLQPLNMGMPFNSPYDDLMMAIDMEKGIGWWATDRNSPDGMVTVYVYILNDLRQNYPTDTEDIESYAALTNYRATQDESKNQEYLSLLKSLTEEKESKNTNKEDFIFPLGKGKIYKVFSDFHNKKAAELMKQYLSKNKELEKKEASLLKLRKSYSANPQASVASQIIEAEESRDKIKQEVDALRKEVYRLEKSSLK